MTKINRNEFSDYIIHPGTSCGICYDENGDILLVEINRHEGVSKEIPGGIIDIGEDPKQALIREIKEETGYLVKNIEFLFYCYSSIGITNEKIYFHKCIIDKKVINGEFNNYFISKKELTNLVNSNSIKDFKTIIITLWDFLN